MDHKSLAATLKNQRAELLVEPIHATIEPVLAYAQQIALKKGEPFNVIKIPEGSKAYSAGYRFASIPHTELDYYVSNGASLAS